MKENTYRRMTKKRSLRGFRLFKQKYLTKHRFYAFLAKIKLVREVKCTTSQPILNNDYMNRVRLLEDRLITDRGVFNLSFFSRGEKQRHQWWYESRFKHHKRLYTVWDDEVIYVEAEVRSQCEEFEVRFNPFTHNRVNRKHYRVFVPQPRPASTFGAENAYTKSKVYKVDFLKARFGTKVTLRIDAEKNNIEEAVKECVQRAMVQMRNYLENNSEAINEKLTGVKADGEFITSDGQRLLPNCVCRRCGRPVFKTAVKDYTAQCIFCGEDLYGIEINKLDPEKYKDFYEFNKYEIYRILAE